MQSLLEEYADLSPEELPSKFPIKLLRLSTSIIEGSLENRERFKAHIIM